MHYNWCSSRSWSVPTSALTDLPESAASQWEEVVGGDNLYNDPVELNGYLRWLEEKKVAAIIDNENSRNEIDELADMFIAQCREKFILEKQESERKFREILARSM